MHRVEGKCDGGGRWSRGSGTRILRRSAHATPGLIPERGNCETTFEAEAAASQIRHWEDP